MVGLVGFPFLLDVWAVAILRIRICTTTTVAPPEVTRLEYADSVGAP